MKCSNEDVSDLPLSLDTRPDLKFQFVLNCISCCLQIACFNGNFLTCNYSTGSNAVRVIGKIKQVKFCGPFSTTGNSLGAIQKWRQPGSEGNGWEKADALIWVGGA